LVDDNALCERIAKMPTKQAQFKTISDPMKAKGDRDVVAKATVQSEGQNRPNLGVTRDNPKHHYSSALEARTPGSESSRSDDIQRCNPGGPAREVPNHAFMPDRPHAHMGTSDSRRAHKFPGRRV
jgi:hypothetical protein